MVTATREQLLDAATKLFAEKGLDRVSLQDIANAAGVNISAVFELFAGVEMLYEALLETQFNLYAARMDAVFEGDELPPKKIELFAKAIQKGAFKRGLNPANATMFLAGMLHYYFLSSRLTGSLLPEPANDEEYLTQALKVYLSGLKKGS